MQAALTKKTEEKKFTRAHLSHPESSAGAEPGDRAALGVPLFLQPKLAISQPGDLYEQEADRVENQIMRMPEPVAQRQCTACAAGGSPCQQCRAGEEPVVLRTVGTGTDRIIPENFLQGLGAGRPLDSSSRAFFEPRFGRDFGAVRIHSDARASEAARSVNARAFTVGQHLVFGKGEYSPQSTEGKRLLAHELTHAAQQGSAATRAAVQREAARPVPRKAIWVNIGFDSSAQANEETIRKLRASIRAEKAALASCCAVHNQACNVDIKQHYDWRRSNKPAPADGDYDSDVAADRALRDRNFDNIVGHAGGVKVLVTESTLSQTWEGARIFPRANTSGKGILWNRALAADDTVAHEAGHAAGYAGDAEGGAHSTDPHNLMSPGSVRLAGATPDANWCQQIAATAT